MREGQPVTIELDVVRTKSGKTEQLSLDIDDKVLGIL